MNLAGFKHLDEFRDEHDFLGRVGERPVLDEPIEKEKSKGGVLGEEEHRASHEVLVEEVASLHLVQRDDHVFEEDDVLLPQWHRKTRDDAGQNVEQLRGAVELEGLVDEGVEAVVDGLSDHLTPGHQLGVKPVKDVLEVFPLSRLFGVEQLQELLNERGSYVHLQSLDVCAVVDDQLQEELVNRLKVWPRRVSQGLFLHKYQNTSSMPMPSPGSPCFLSTGSGLKMFFSTMLMTRSRCGMMTVDMQFWSLR